MTQLPDTNSGSRIWIIDASMSSRERGLCFCPLEDDAIITGLSYLSNTLPNEEKCVGVWHPDGDEIAGKWADDHADMIEHLWKKTA